MKVGEHIYYENVLLIRKRNQIKYKIGRSVILEHKDGKLAIHINMSSFIRQFVKDYDFLTNAIKHGSFTVGGFNVTLDEEDAKRFGSNLKAGINTYKYYKKIQILMDYLGCYTDSDDTVDFESGKLKEEDYRGLSILYRAIVEKKTVKDIITTGGMFTAFKIADKTFIVEINKVRSKYRLKKVEHKDWVEFTKESGTDIPFAVIYKKEEYLNCLNIEFEKILPSLQELPHGAYLYNLVNIIALRMVSAIDEAHGIRKIQLQDTAIKLFGWLNSIEDMNEWDRRISKINYYQIEKRRRSLSESEIEDINDVIDESDDNNMLRFGAYVLLEDEKRAEKFFDRLTKNEKEMIRTMPIYSLWKKKK